jgi:hypothetical protein
MPVPCVPAWTPMPMVEGGQPVTDWAKVVVGREVRREKRRKVESVLD